MLLFDVTNRFDLELRNMCSEYNVPYEFFKNHERRPLVLNNLCEEILKQENTTGVKLGAKRRNYIVKVGAALFVDHAVKQRHQSLKSRAEQQRLRDSQKTLKEKAVDAEETLADIIKIKDSTIEA